MENKKSQQKDSNMIENVDKEGNPKTINGRQDQGNLKAIKKDQFTNRALISDLIDVRGTANYTKFSKTTTISGKIYVKGASFLSHNCKALKDHKTLDDSDYQHNIKQHRSFNYAQMLIEDRIAH